MNFHQSLTQIDYNKNWSDQLANNYLSKFTKTDVPTRKNELWKYSNLNSFLADDYEIASEQMTGQEDHSGNFHHIKVNLFDMKSTFESLKAIGINAYPLEQGDDKALTKLIENDYLFSNDYLGVLNNSYLKLAWVLDIPKDFTLDKPVFLDYYFHGHKKYFCFQNFYLIGENAKVDFIESFKSADSDKFINYKSHAHIQENASFEQIIFQNTSKEDSIALSFNSIVEKHAHFQNNIFTKGAKFSRTNFYTNINGDQANVDAHGLYHLDDKQHHDTMSFIHHNHAHTYSNQLYKGILNDNARGVFTGRVRVEQHAQLIDAKQLNKNLLLSPKAQANSRPQMEIYADDVKCAHGSTTGQISEEELFYFESRGITPEKAHRMLANAYSNDVILKVRNLKIRKFLQTQMSNLEF